MKTTSILILISIAIGTHSKGFAQNDLMGRSTTWSVSEHMDTSSGEVVNQHSTVVISNSEIVWGAEINSDAYQMSVSAISGTWDMNTNIGEVVYNVSVSNGSGTVTITGDGTNLTINIHIVFNNGSADLELKAENVSYN